MLVVADLGRAFMMGSRRREVDRHLLRGDWRLAVVGPVSDREELREMLPARA